MIYVALLRGINVGGKNKVEMSRAKALFEQMEFTDVVTYINSGNIIFRDETTPSDELVSHINQALEDEFGFPIKTIVRDIENIHLIKAGMPDEWVNDQTMRCDVMFLSGNLTEPKVLEQLTIKSGIDDIKYTVGTIIWRVDRDKVTKSGMMKLVGSELYKNMTIRNCNTLRKIARLMDEL